MQTPTWKSGNFTKSGSKEEEEYLLRSLWYFAKRNETKRNGTLRDGTQEGPGCGTADEQIELWVKF